MTEPNTGMLSADKTARLAALFEKLLPLIDGLADKLRQILILGVLVLGWIGYWLFGIKHYSVAIGLSVIGVALLPMLIIIRFWWSLEELKNLPAIADDMLGDAKNELRTSIQGFQAGKIPKFGFFSASKGLWSMGSMLMEAKDLLGSYLSVATLVNPFMLVLGVISLIGVGVMTLLAFALVFSI